MRQSISQYALKSLKQKKTKNAKCTFMKQKKRKTILIQVLSNKTRKKMENLQRQKSEKKESARKRVVYRLTTP